MAPFFDPYEALGLPRNASPAQIRAQYRRLARRYHPNRHPGPDESKAGLAEKFHIVHQAWKHLAEPTKRRRYQELLTLADEQDALLLRMADLLASEAHEQHGPGEDKRIHDGHVSSDGEDSQREPTPGLTRRRTNLERAMSVKTPVASSLAVRPHHKREKHPRMSILTPSLDPEPDTTEADYFATRRKALERLRREELAAFQAYEHAFRVKVEAELRAERAFERYSDAKAEREYHENSPVSAKERFRSFVVKMNAANTFGQQQTRRRRDSVYFEGQILPTNALEDSLSPGGDDMANSSRGRTVSRRAWNSDITADQEDSDEDDNGNAPSSSWSRHHKRNVSIDLFDLPHDPPCTDSRKAPLPGHSAFKMVVRQPTGLDETEIVEDEPSRELATGTSRRHSPPINTNNFTLPNSDRLSELLRTARSRSPSPANHGRSPSPGENAHRKSTPPPDASILVLRQVRPPRNAWIDASQVRMLNLEEKKIVLSAEADADVSPAELMRRLRRLDDNVAARFTIKQDIKESFTFRLITGTPDLPETFIALSYRRRLQVVKEGTRYTLPLKPELYQALLDERSSEKEGVWIDQVCIAPNRTETTISMSAMDLVYRSARLVVVILDDIELDAHEGEMLENHMREFVGMTHVQPSKRFRGKQPPYFEQREGLYNITRKILLSSWFKRAWCRHEMRLAREHVFLVPCKSPGTWNGMSIARFTGACLTHLLGLAIEVSFEPPVEMVKPPLHAFFRDRSKLDPKQRHLYSHHGNFTTVVAEVLAMDSGGDPTVVDLRQRAADALKDKMAIVLNTLECGLAITTELRDPSMPLSKAECQYMLLTLALAAQDPGSLCSVGPPMRLVGQFGHGDSPVSPTASSTWLFEPTNVDSGLNNYRTLKRLDKHAQISTGLHLGEHYVCLNLKFLHHGKVHGAPEDPKTMEIAANFVDYCKRKKLGRNRSRYLINDVAANRHFGSMEEVYIQTTACVMICGPDWLEDICQRYGVSRWKRDGEGAWNLLVALKNTDGRWPQHAWSEQHAAFIMDFVNFLIIRGMPQRQVLRHEEWRPLWVSTENGGKLLTFAPTRKCEPAIPTALLEEDYIHLARLWLLEPRQVYWNGDGRNTQQWTLLGKSVLFSDELAMQGLHSPKGSWLDQQWVFGREDHETQALLRERSLLGS